MSKDEKTETEQSESKKQEPKKPDNRVLDILQKDGDLIGNVIERFAQSEDEPITDDQKDYMRNYAIMLSEKWNDIIIKIEGGLMDPETRKEIAKKLRVRPKGDHESKDWPE